jgi:class 3 adenylate cyclase
MVGFTSFSERSGEEAAAFTLMRTDRKPHAVELQSLNGHSLTLTLMDDAVRQQGVQGFTGDGTTAVFGAPADFEDAPLRACRVALSDGCATAARLAAGRTIEENFNGRLRIL